MTREEYIAWVAPRIVVDSINRNLLPSFRIAQACFEPNFGTSELAINANNLFGVKNNDQWQGRCYSKGTKECYDGVKLEDVQADFRAYDSWDESIVDQGDFLINRCTTPKHHPEIKHYAELVGNRDYKDCARILKEKNYGTSPDYDKRVIDYVERYNLTRYDSMTMEEALGLIAGNNEGKEDVKMIINVHAGHNPDGKVACGAVGLIKESTEARNVKAEVISQLRQLGHTVYDCTCDNGTSKTDVLKKIVAMCNSHSADLEVAIHFNSGAGDKTGNGKTTGTEVYVYSESSNAKSYAEKVCQEIAALDFKNRGVKYSKSLYVLKNTKAPAMLVECCFVDDKDDVERYNYRDMAAAIVKGITGQTVTEKEEVPEEFPAGSETTTGTGKTMYRVQVGAYGQKANAEAMKKKLKAAGFDAIITTA